MDQPISAEEAVAAVPAPEGLVNTALAVVTQPAAFYRSMAKSGGFQKPLVFAVVMGILSGLVQAALLAVGFKPGAGLIMAVAALILTPLAVGIFGFVGAAFAWISWKLMGSNESYETAYRCSAYASAITPLTALAGVIPLIGASVGMIWMTALVIVSSVEVHKIDKRKAQFVFGGLCALFVALSIGGQLAARAMRAQLGALAGQNSAALGQFAQQMQAQTANMTPEQKKAMEMVMGQLQQAAQQAGVAAPQQANAGPSAMTTAMPVGMQPNAGPSAMQPNAGPSAMQPQTAQPVPAQPGQ